MCCSRRARFTASSGGAACTFRRVRATTSARSHRALRVSSTTRRWPPAEVCSTARTPVRRLQQLVELEHPLSGRDVVHHGSPRVQGRLQQRLRPSREHAYTSPTTHYFFNFANGVPELSSRIGSRLERSRSTWIATWASSRRTSGRSAGGHSPAAIRFDNFKNSFPPQSIAPTLLAPNLNVSYPQDRQLQLARHHPEARRDLRSVW